jgi:hypothetical protein
MDIRGRPLVPRQRMDTVKVEGMARVVAMATEEDMVISSESVRSLRTNRVLNRLTNSVQARTMDHRILTQLFTPRGALTARTPRKAED